MSTDFLLLSGIVTLIFGILKLLYINYKVRTKLNPIIMPLLLFVMGIIYIIYMSRLFFIDETLTNYGTIIGITIASLSFAELTYLIIGVIKAKNKDIIHYSYRYCNLSAGLFAIVNTESALLAMTEITIKWQSDF